MRYAHRDLPVEEFRKPETGLTSVTVCAVSGLLPGKYCAKTYPEYFLSGTEPRTICEVCEFADTRSKTVNENLRNSLLGPGSLGDTGLDKVDVPPLEGLDAGKSSPARGNPLLD
jgi:penicillin-binding protein 1A